MTLAHLESKFAVLVTLPSRSDRVNFEILYEATAKEMSALSRGVLRVSLEAGTGKT